MKLTKSALLVAVCLGAAATLPAPPVQGQTPRVFSTSFDCPEWRQIDWVDPCFANDGIGLFGGWRTSLGNGDQITLAANNPLGAGRGFRHWRGNGQNNNGGGISISWGTALSEIWIRWYMRYSTGFAWTGGAPKYTKDFYASPGETAALIGGFSDGKFYIHTTSGSQSLHSARTWTQINGGSLGDGKFHAYEMHLKLGSTGRVDFWVDGQAVGSITNVNWGRTTFGGGMVLGENQWDVLGGDYYTDYDDLVVSSTGYIGPIGGTTPPPPAAPTNVRILR